IRHAARLLRSVFLGPDAPAQWPPHALVILFDRAFPRQRSKSPREQRFAAVVSDGDYLLQPEPLVLTARAEQMDWDHHSVFQHPIDVRLAVSRALLDVHVGQAEAVEEDDG